MHICPLVSQSVALAIRTSMLPVPAGLTVTSHLRVVFSSSWTTLVNVPPVMVSAWSRISCTVVSTSSLKTRVNLNAVEPSWYSSRFASRAFS